MATAAASIFESPQTAPKIGFYDTCSIGVRDGWDSDHFRFTAFRKLGAARLTRESFATMALTRLNLVERNGLASGSRRLGRSRSGSVLKTTSKCTALAG